jgi:hypothetical protein
MKFCKDCANYSPMKYSSDDGICSAPEHGINLVIGEPNTKTCSSQRSTVERLAGYCGVEGLFFKPALKTEQT